jgi:hypothetical protein
MMLSNYAAVGAVAGLIGLFIATVLSLLNTRRILKRLRANHATTFGDVSWSTLFTRSRAQGRPDLVQLLNSKDQEPLGDAVLAKLFRRHRRLNRAAVILFLVGGICLMVIVSTAGRSPA